MRAVAKPGPGAFLDITTLLFGRSSPSGGSIRGMGSSALKKLEDALLRAVHVRFPMPLSVVALALSVMALTTVRGGSATFRGVAATVTQCVGLICCECVCFLAYEGVAGSHCTLMHYLIRGMCTCCIMCVVTSGMRSGHAEWACGVGMRSGHAGWT